MIAPLRHAWLRSFSVQGSFNYDRMVGVGLAYVMEPLVRPMAGGEREPRYRRALGRAAAFFNAHPYFVTLAAAALARAEGDDLPEAQVTRFRNALIASLGSVGDRLVWAGWLPACSGLGLLVSAVVSPLVGAVTFLLTYNALHLPLRWWGLRAGWQAGPQVAAALSGTRMQRALRVAGRAAPFLAGAAIPVTAQWLAQGAPPAAFPGVAAAAVSALIIGKWLAPALGGVRIGLALVGTAFLVGLLWP
ncbi:MAG TPA: PTS system mannose/fructose/sorbose family transporter subunit IID [Gemmatimonadales bacterium]|nr:PTS system mannose/fructose/sorbose family transporter subunit IID [Gemmatimonadales bacterium]